MEPNVNTTIEYLYHTAMTREAGTVKLTGEDIRNAYGKHTNGLETWYATAVADVLMETGAVPPGTSAPSVNPYRAIVDSVITVEYLGALAPGRPDVALDIAQLPIRTVAGGYGASAGQFEVALASLAPAIPTTLATGADRMDWLVRTAARYLPQQSVIREVAEFLADYVAANPGQTVATLKAAYRTAFPTTSTPALFRNLNPAGFAHIRGHGWLA
jgi:hypothetical protein